MWLLRQSTAGQVIQLGPFVDASGDAVTSLTVANTDIKLRPLGATSATSKNSGGATHSAAGNYYATLDATDTATVGPMKVSVHVAGALPVWLDCCVLAGAVYDVLFGATAPSTHTAAGVWASATRTLTAFGFSVNVASLNGVTLTGNGSSGNPWGPA